MFLERSLNDPHSPPPHFKHLSLLPPSPSTTPSPPPPKNFDHTPVRVEDQRFKDWNHYKFTFWQTQLNFMVFCASSACDVSVEHLNAKKHHIRRILKLVEIPLPYENSFNQYNNLYNYEMFIIICGEYGVSNNLTKWRNQKYFSTWQSRAWETGKSGMSYINENLFSRWIIEKSDGLTTLGLQKLSETVRDHTYLVLTSQTSTRGPIVGH